jgi:hypothetical protein
LSKCIECTEEFYFEFREKIESLRILENSARWALSWSKNAQKESFRALLGREVLRRDTYRVNEYFVELSKEGLSKRSSGGHQISLLRTQKGESPRDSGK